MSKQNQNHEDKFSWLEPMCKLIEQNRQIAEIMKQETHAEKLLRVSMEYTLQPKINDRCDVIISAYEYLLNNFAYDQEYCDEDDYGYARTYVDVVDIKNLITKLKELKKED